MSLLLAEVRAGDRAGATPAPGSVAPETITFSLPLVVSEIGESTSGLAPLPPPRPGQPALEIRSDDGREARLPLRADTTVARDNDKPHGLEAVVLHEGRSQAGLFKVNTIPVSSNTMIRSAAFCFSIGWHARAGGGMITFHRMLADWTEEATGKRSGGQAGIEWQNLREGIDYEAKPFAIHRFPAVTNGVQRAEGFEKALGAWLKGEWPNYGFIAFFSGGASQVNISSRESGVKPSPVLHLGGATGSRILLVPDVAMLRRLLLQDRDLQDATCEVIVSGVPKGDKPVLALYSFNGKATSVGSATAHRLLDRVPVNAIAGSPTRISNLAGWLRACLTGTETATNLLLQVAGTANPLSLAMVGARAPALVVTITKHPSVDVFKQPLQPLAGNYVNVKADGHLYYGGQRLKLWGVNRNDSPNLSIVDRLHKAGFNAIRLWPAEYPYDAASVAQGRFRVSTGEVANVLDTYDRFVAEARQRGLFILSPLLHSHGIFDSRSLEGILAPDSFLADAGAGRVDWNEWCAAIRTDRAIVNSAFYFDERAALAMKRHAANVLNHINPYTGRRYAEEEAIAIWQVQNENGFVYKVMERGVDNWPAYFRIKLQKRWNAWLKNRYRDQAGLLKAWGRVAVGESLEADSIAFAPTLLNRKDFPARRGDDLAGFLVDLVVEFNRDFRGYCRALAPEGIGVNAAPFIFDCQYRPSIPWLASQALAGSAVAISAYEWNLTSRLSAPPSFYTLDNHTVEGCPTIVYETNTADTNPFRAEYPFRVAALASRQDWDGVFFHIYHAPDENKAVYTPDEQYLLEKLPYLRLDHYWSGTHFAGDPAFGASLAVAGQMFLRTAIPPAQAPAIYDVSDAAIHSYRFFNGIDQRADTFSCGSRFRFGKRSEEPDLNVERPATPGSSPVTYDFTRGRLIIDTPTAKAYVGRTGGRHVFTDGLVVGDFSTPFVAWGIVSQDGRPLAGENPAVRAIAAAANNAANTGFVMDMSLARQSAGFVPPLQLAAAIKSYGRAPIVVDPVGWSLWFPRVLSLSRKSYDFAFRELDPQRITLTNCLRGDAGREVFLYDITMSDWGRSAAVPMAKEDDTTSGAKGRGTGLPVPLNRAVSPLWNPLPGLNWGDAYSIAHQKMRDGNFLRSGVSGDMLTDKQDASFTVFDAEVLLGCPANITISYERGLMMRVAVAFTQPPPLLEAVAAYKRQFGNPVEERLTSNAFETSTVKWIVAAPQGAEKLTILLTESQGTLGLTFVREIR